MTPVVAIRHPEYFPSLAYCALMDSVDRFVIDLSRQYSRQSCQNRARIRTPDGTQWLSIPLVGGQFGSAISATRIDPTDAWSRKHKKALQFNYGSTPFFEHYCDSVFDVLEGSYDSLGALTSRSTIRVHEWLNLKGELEVIGRGADENEHSASEAVVIESIPPPRIVFNTVEYRQNFDGFVGGLTILDLLFNHGPEALRILRSSYHVQTNDP